MTESHINKLSKIDVRLQLINEERLALLNGKKEKRGQVTCFVKKEKGVKRKRGQVTCFVILSKLCLNQD
jgi:hypothetical protein